MMDGTNVAGAGAAKVKRSVLNQAEKSGVPMPAVGSREIVV